MIRTRQLTKQYGSFKAVDTLDLEIQSGQFYGLLGANGAGKSTTIHMLTTMTAPSSGQAWVSQLDVAENPVLVRQTVGLVFQDSALDRAMSVNENLQFAAALYNLPAKESDQRINKLLSMFSLADKRQNKLADLSGGQRRAVDIARGVLHHPKVLFLDEPTIGLDLPNRRAVWRFVEQLRQDERITIFLTTHYLEEAESCDQVDFIQNGHLQHGGKPVDLIAQLGAYILEIDCIDPEKIAAQLVTVFGEPLREDLQLSFKVPDQDFDFHKLQHDLSNQVSLMQWRRPNLNDVYMWRVGQYETGKGAS